MNTAWSRWTRWAALVLVALLTLAACGGADETDDASADSAGSTEEAGGDTADDAASEADAGGSGEAVELSFAWFEWPPAQLLEDFANENYPDENVTVSVDAVPLAQWRDLIFTQFAAGETDFDIPILDSQWLGEAVEGGHIVDMSDFARENIELDAYAPNLLGAYAQYPLAPDGNFDPEGPVYGLPLLADTWVLVYRTDLVGEEPPETWDEMLQMAEQCQSENEGMAGLAFHGNNDYDVAGVTLNTVIWVNGGEIWDPEAEEVEGVLNSEQNIAAAQQLADAMVPLAPDGVGTAFIGEVNAAISQGDACMGMNWVAGLEGIQDPANSTLGETEEEILDKLGFAPIPPGEANVKPLGGMGMHVSSYTDKTEEILAFIEWFQQPDVQEAWAEFGGVPARTDALNSDAFIDARPWNAAFAESVPNLRDFWNTPEYARMLDAHTSNANAIITGVKSPEQALNDAAEAEQQALGGGL